VQEEIERRVHIKELEGRVAVLEGDMSEMKEDIKNIMRNHLPHLQLEVSTLTNTIKILGGLIISGITALIIMGLS